jgi:periplasmic protein TonB
VTSSWKQHRTASNRKNRIRSVRLLVSRLVFTLNGSAIATHIAKHMPSRRRVVPAVSTILVAAIIAGCSSTPPPPLQATPSAQPSSLSRDFVAAPLPQKSNAATARAYRSDAAAHLYSLNPDRIYRGKLPPLLYAIGVLQVEVDGRGNVRTLSWMRAPKHAPEVIVEIERTVRAAAPFPAPTRMGKVVYTDTWLWHKSGRFQLDTLTEGQL